MRQDIRLFLGDREVEFNAAPQILYNYTETDFHNPTTVKNSFTKSISVPGTKKNNDTFGHFWDLERYQDFGGSIGPAFNPMTKTDFTLYVGGNLYEKGYCKLNSVTKDGTGFINYEITLFGGIGQFLSRLSFQVDSEMDSKLSLADLDYDFAEPGVESTLQEWLINKDEIWNAWGRICNYGDTNSARYDMIQYVPYYCGTPEGFSSDKVLINYNNGLPTDVFKDVVVDNDVAYSPVNGYALGNYDGNDLTPWTTLDLRSYLMMPAVRMKYIIDACGNPAINGGYELDLDSHFFNYENPYYYESFMTLGTFKSLGLGQGDEEDISGGATLRPRTGTRTDLFDIVYTGATLDDISNTSVTLRVGFTPTDSTAANTLYTDTSYEHGIEIYKSAGGCIAQLWAMDASDNIVGTSNTYLLSSTQYKANSQTALWWNYYNPNEKDKQSQYSWVEGVWKRVGGSYVFCNRSGSIINLNFKLNASVQYDHLVLKIKWPYTSYIRAMRWELYYPTDNNEDNFYDVNPTGFPMYTTEQSTSSEYLPIEDAVALNRVRGSFNYEVVRLGISNEAYGDFLSNGKASKKLLLSGDKTPADILLSYAKLFGLYFYYDPKEEASDPATYPNGVIHLMDRNTFFTEEIVDIDGLIDYSKNSVVKPTVAVQKWLSFNTEQIESQANNDYRQKYGYDYGRALVNTSYNYDLGTTDLYDGNAFKGGVMVREKNNLYAYGGTSYGGETNVDYIYPLYIASPKFTYSLFNGDSNIELPVGGYLSFKGNNLNNLGLAGYDSFPKLQAHTEDNSPSDGSGVLLFLNGSFTIMGQYKYWMVDHYEYQDVSIYYNITDDVATMADLNDDEPCYLFTLDEFDIYGERIARPVNKIPNFTRDWIPGPQQQGYIVHSWNFGHPQETFVPNTYSTDGDSLYDKAWKNYIRDTYDVNTKSFTAFVKFDSVDVSMFRKYFWFSNGLWRLNAVRDYNVNGYDTVQCEFIKVQDIENFKLDEITAGGGYSLVLDTYTIDMSGGTIGGTVTLQGGGNWFRGDAVKIAYSNGESHYEDSDTWVSPATGSGLSSRLTVTVPENTSAYTKYITIYVEYEDYPPMTATITQRPEDTPVINIVRYVTLVAEGETRTINFTYSNILPETLAMTTTYGPLTTPWLTATLNSGGTIVLSAGTNNTGSERGAVLTLTATATRGGTATATCTVTQDGGELYVNPLTLVFDYDSTTGKTLTITTNGDWSATINDT